jgi:hypothetical protein
MIIATDQSAVLRKRTLAKTLATHFNQFRFGIVTPILLNFAAGLAITLSPLAAKTAPAPLSPLQKISQSFSDDKLGRTTMPKGAKLMQSEFNNPECSLQKLADCYVIDAKGVELYFSPYDGLNSKQISISAQYEGAVRAVGIGIARSQKDVLAAAALFIPRLLFKCIVTDAPEGQRVSYTTCTGNIPEKMGAKSNPAEPDPSQVEFVFGADNRIKSALVRNSNYID